MKNVIQTMVITTLFCIPQLSYGVNILKVAGGFLGVSGFFLNSIGDSKRSRQVSSAHSAPLAKSNQAAEVYQVAHDVRNACNQVGIKPSEVELKLSNSERVMHVGNGETWHIPEDSHMVQAVANTMGSTKKITVALNEKYFSLPEELKKVALVPELIRLKQYEEEKEIAVGTLAPLVMAKSAFSLVGRGITSLVARSTHSQAGKCAALALRGVQTLSRSYLAPFISTTMYVEFTKLEKKDGYIDIRKSYEGPSISLWQGYQFKLPAAYKRSRVHAIDLQAVKVVGMPAMVEYLSQEKYESKERYEDPAYEQMPSFKERLVYLQTHAK